jgi:hypothetical protein
MVAQERSDSGGFRLHLHLHLHPLFPQRARICDREQPGSTIPYMMEKKRISPRIPVESLCTEVIGERDQLGLVVDIGVSGLRLQRPLRGRAEGRIVQIEFELPEADEIVWAKGEICFDQLWRNGLRTSGVRLVAAAQRHLRMLREFVHDIWAPAPHPWEDGGSWVMRAGPDTSCLLRASHWD